MSEHRNDGRGMPIAWGFLLAPLWALLIFLIWCFFCALGD